MGLVYKIDGSEVVGLVFTGFLKNAILAKYEKEGVNAQSEFTLKTSKRNIKGFLDFSTLKLDLITQELTINFRAVDKVLLAASKVELWRESLG